MTVTGPNDSYSGATMAFTSEMIDDNFCGCFLEQQIITRRRRRTNSIRKSIKYFHPLHTPSSKGLSLASGILNSAENIALLIIRYVSFRFDCNFSISSKLIKKVASLSSVSSGSINFPSINSRRLSMNVFVRITPPTLNLSTESEVEFFIPIFVI